MFSGLLVFLFCETVILYNLLFQKLHPLFFVFCLARGLKIETLSNFIYARLVSCLIEWMIS